MKMLGFQIFYCVVFFLYAARSPEIAVQADQVRGSIVDPNTPHEQSTPERGPQTEIIYFLTTSRDPDERSFLGGTTGSPPGTGKWVRKTTQYPDRGGTTENYGPHGPPPDSVEGTTRDYRPNYGRTTESPYGRRATPGYRTQTTEDPNERTTFEYPGYRQTTESYPPYGRRTTQDYSRFGITERPEERTTYPSHQRTTEPYVPYGRRTTQDNTRFGQTEEPEERTTWEYPGHRRTTEPYNPYGRRTTQDYSRFGLTREPEERTKWGYPSPRRTTEPYNPYGRRTTAGYPRFGTDKPEERTTRDYNPGYSRTTEPYIPYGRRTSPDYRRYGTTEGIDSHTDRYAPYRRTTPDPYRSRYTTVDYGYRTTDSGSSRGSGDPNLTCQRSSQTEPFRLDRNVCVEYINCCQRYCREKNLKPKGSCKHDTERGFDRISTYCSCVEYL